MEAIEAAAPKTARPRKARSVPAELSEDQKPSEELVPAAAVVEVVTLPRRFPALIPEGVTQLAEAATKLQYIAAGVAVFFAAVAVVVQRHEQRYHHGPPAELSDDIG